eukprot:170387-Lingulodinium_polyedra.AAC.1
MPFSGHCVPPWLGGRGGASDWAPRLGTRARRLQERGAARPPSGLGAAQPPPPLRGRIRAPDALDAVGSGDRPEGRDLLSLFGVPSPVPVLRAP